MENLSISKASTITAVINYDDEYVQPLICSALESRLPKESYTRVDSLEGLTNSNSPVLQIRAYEELDFDHVMEHSSTSLANAYIIRKALIRKHYLSATVSNWTTKHPDSILAGHTKPSCHFELDYAEFLDDALVEAWELQESFQKNEGKEPQDREWWILKPGMSDRGQGIRLFSTYDELQAIFEEWEADRPDSDDEFEEDEDSSAQKETQDAEQDAEDGDYIITSHLRHFIAQPYIDPPLLLPSDPRKFHIRTYVLAVGGLKVYVYRPMLALFARDAYISPASSSSPDSLPAHLTNTCIQESFPSMNKTASESSAELPSVRKFWSLPDEHPSLGGDYKSHIFKQICAVTGETFVAAAKEMSIHFQAIPNAFEVFGVDFLVDAQGDVYLLEVNAFPDFRQTGDALKGLVGGLWEGVIDIAVAGFFNIPRVSPTEAGQEDDMVLVGEVDMGRR